MRLKTIHCRPTYDGYKWYRVIIDTYWYRGSNFDLVNLAIEATGVDWVAFGCFMDTCCIATKEVTGDFTMKIKWCE